jgi:Ca-activated chloride channel family protein
LKCIIRESGDEKTLHVQNVSTTEKYIVGKYDIEILTTPRIVYKNLQLKENAVTSLEIPQPGKLMVVAFNKFYLADIYLMSGNEQVFVSRMSIDSRNTNIVLQPGVYKFVYRPKDSYRSAQTFEREFEIKSGSTTNMTF